MGAKSELTVAARATVDEAEEVRVEGAIRSPRLPGRTVALFLLGAIAVGGLLYHVGIDDVADLLATLGWYAPLALVPYAVTSLFDTLGWMRTFSHHGRNRMSMWRVYFIRHAGEAISNLTPSAGLGGEPLKALLLRRHGLDAGEGVASVIIAKTAMVCTQFVFTLVGVYLFLESLGLLRARAPMLIAAGVGAALVCVILVILQRRGLAARVVRLLDRLGVRWAFVKRLEAQAEAIDRAFVRFYRDDRGGFAITAGYLMIGWLLGVGEVMLLFFLMGVTCGWRDALIIESLTQATMAAAAIVPGGLGVQEISGAVLCRILGIGEAAGAALMLLKRGREMAYTALGVALISWLARGTPANQKNEQK